MTTRLTLIPRVAFGDRVVTSPSVQQLLALLAGDLHAGAGAGRLIDGLWPEEQPANPTKALQVLVSRARAQLGHQAIVNTANGYRLALTEHEVDACAAGMFARAAADAARSGDPATALARAEDGIELFSGFSIDAHGDDADHDPLTVLRRQLLPGLRSLRRLRALALARLGRRDEALPALAGVLQNNDRDEEVLAALLRCEAAVIGTSTALERYESYRRTLREQLGTDPGRELQDLHAELLAGDAPPVRRGLLHDPNPLLGRGQDLDAVVSLIDAARVTSIIGPGGLGKTRMAHAVARRVGTRSAFFVPLAGIDDPALVADEVASVLGVRDARPSATSRYTRPVDVLTGIIDACGPAPALLVLDNCEHVLDGAAELARSLISMSPDLRLLTTSRAPLGIAAESVYLLPELDLATSVDLFRTRASAARPDVDLTGDAVQNVCEHLDGLPLAVELAAARTRVLTVPQIAQRLGDRFALLRGGRRDAPERHRTLEAVIDWSWRLLDPAEQSALHRLSVFPDGFTLDAAEFLVGADALASVEHLVDQSLLKVVGTAPGRQARYRMLETVREFAGSRLTAEGGDDAATTAFCRWARRYGERYAPELFGPDPFPALEAIRAELDNLVGAFNTAARRRDAATCAATFAAAAGLWTLASQHSRVTTLTPELTYVQSHHRPPGDEVPITRMAMVLGLMVTMILRRAECTRALLVLMRLPVAEPPDPISGLGTALIALLRPGSRFRSTLAELNASDEPTVAAAAAVLSSHVWENDGELEAALEAAQRYVALLGPTGNPWMRAVGQLRVGEMYMQLGRRSDGERQIRQALPLIRRIGAASETTQAIWVMALARLGDGDIDGAEALVRSAGREPIDDDFAVHVMGVSVQAEIALAKGETADGLRRWRRAVDAVQGYFGAYAATTPRGLEPWTMATEAVAIIAHSRNGALGEVADLAERLTGKALTLLREALADPGGSSEPIGAGEQGGDASMMFFDFPVCGTVLVATGVAELARLERIVDDPPPDDLGGSARTAARRSRAVRLIALSRRFGPPSLYPSMSADTAEQQAVCADRPGYSSAVDGYARLDRREMQRCAYDLLSAVVPAETAQA